MESLNSVFGIPYVFHCGIVSVVCVGAALLFVFGFKSAEEPFFNKGDSRSIAKKKKGKEKKLLNGNGSPPESKGKGNSTPKPKAKSNEEKSKKPNALKDSKKVNLNPKSAQKELVGKGKQKSKGKENVDAVSDFDDEAMWEQAMSRKKNRKNQTVIPEALKKDKKSSGKSNDAKKAKEGGNKNKDSAKKEPTAKGDKSKDDGGDWQEAKSSKKRRKVQKED